jgi:hypothetical protein
MQTFRHIRRGRFGLVRLLPFGGVVVKGVEGDQIGGGVLLQEEIQRLLGQDDDVVFR